jgi:RND family efflux transporter MFP subunit
MTEAKLPPVRVSTPQRRNLLPVGMIVGTAALLAGGAALFFRARSQVNHVALASAPKGVTVTLAKEAHFRPSRRYVGTLEPWVDAKVGPQFVAAYIDTVLVRPGATVKKGDVLATLDCRNASATSKAVTEQAHAVEAMQAAMRHESERIGQLQDGGYVSPNEVEQKSAESASKQAQLLALQAQMMGSSLQVNDCVLRAPFDGDVADRVADPGGFARPGTAIVSVVDRSTIRLTADVPEDDFADVAPGTPAQIHIIPTGEKLSRPIARRAPAADVSTRTVHIEIDIADPQRHIPVYTTAEIGIDVGEPQPAVELPLAAVSIRGSKASLFTVQNEKARGVSVPVLGESGGNVYLDPSLSPGTAVVLQGKTLLADGDAVVSKRTDEPSKTAEATGQAPLPPKSAP